MSKVLSIFCDESGDFGDNAKSAPYYLVSFVFHEQDNDISKYINELKYILKNLNVDSDIAIHATPLIRNSGLWNSHNLIERQKILKSLLHFMRLTNVKTKTICTDRRKLSDYRLLPEYIFNSIEEFITENYSYLSEFDKVIIYYDKGQRKLNSVLRTAFGALLPNTAFRIIKPNNFYLFQVSDLVCTLKLLDIKFPKLNKLEQKFFGSPKWLRKNYLRDLYRSEF